LFLFLAKRCFKLGKNKTPKSCRSGQKTLLETDRAYHAPNPTCRS
jgi:hypothetical protein